MSPRRISKALGRILPKKKKKTDIHEGLPAPCVESLTKELAEQSGRVPYEARADLVMTQVHLTRRSVPDEDPEQTLLLWLARRGFHDVLALRADAGFELTKRKRKGLDLCLWVDPERLMRASINKDPTKPPKQSGDLSNEERASLVQAATCVLAEAKEKNMLSYNKLFLLHEPTTLERLRRLQRTSRIFWDRGDVLLDAIAAYFGTKVGYYFAWLKFYTAALLYPTLVGLLVWWTERANSHPEAALIGRDETSPACASTGDVCQKSSESWSRWTAAATGAVPGDTVVQPEATCCEDGNELVGWKWGNAGAASLTPSFNVFVAVWATLFLVMWKRRSNTLAFRWGVHKEDTIERARYMVGWKSHGRVGLNAAAGEDSKQSSSSGNSSAGTGSCGGATADGGAKTNGSSSAIGRLPLCKGVEGMGLRRECAKGKFRANAAARAAATLEGSEGEGWRVGAAIREDGLGGGSWEPLRTARLFASWTLEALMLYLAIRMMLWFAWLEVRSLQKFGEGFNVHLVRMASVILPTTFYGMHAKWAKALTDWEGHVTEAAAENSMIVKRFTFHSVNSYSRLFYLGFWQRDLAGLNQMLMTVLITRSSMDALQEVVSPIIQVQLRRRMQSASSNGRVVLSRSGRQRPAPARAAPQQPRRHRNQSSIAMITPEVACRAMDSVSSTCPLKKQQWREALSRQRTLPEYKTHGEFLELMIQYGYVTMFAVAFPLAPLLALIRCLAEIYIDHQKLLKCRRPPHLDRSGIGAWYGILEFVGMASVLTNCLLLALTAEKLRLHIPIPLANQFPSSKYLIMAVFAEHMILGVKAAVRVLIDDVPDGVERAMAEELLHDQEVSRQQVEEALGFGHDVEATHVTIVRQQAAAGSSSSLMADDSSSHSTKPVSTSSGHMLSSSSKRQAGDREQHGDQLHATASGRSDATWGGIDTPSHSRLVRPNGDLPTATAVPYGERSADVPFSSIHDSMSDAGDLREDCPGGMSADGKSHHKRYRTAGEAAALRSVFSDAGSGPRRRHAFGATRARPSPI